MQMFRSAESVSLLITAVSGMMVVIAVATSAPIPARDASFDYNSDALDVSAGIPLNAIQDPAAVLPSMPVETSKGEQLGEVRSVKLGPKGAVQAVTVATRGLFGLTTVTATLNADDLVYLRERNSLVSRLTQSEIATQADRRVKARRSL
jgi:hypothetical protein